MISWSGCTGRSVVAAVVTALVGLACSPGLDDASKKPPLSPLAAEGKQIYAAQCTACHDSNPSRVGSLGPAVAGSSADLLDVEGAPGGVSARVLLRTGVPGDDPDASSRREDPGARGLSRNGSCRFLIRGGVNPS